MISISKRAGRVLTVHTGDEHVGSTVGLCPPSVSLDDGGQYTASPAQRWYWDCWERFWEDTARLKRKLGARVVYLHGGDEAEGDHHGTRQIWFVSEADQERAIDLVFEVPARVVDEWVFVRSTEAHDGPQSAGTEKRAKRWAERCWKVIKNGELNSFWIYTGVLGGVRFQVKHQPQTRSYLPHTRDTSASRQAFLVWESYVEDGLPPPQIAIWHHIHYRSQGWYREVYSYTCPPWQLPSSWSAARYLSTPHPERPGGIRFLCEDGTWIPYELRFRPKSEVAWAK